MKTCIFKNKKIFPIYPVTIDAKQKQVYIDRPFGMDINQIFIVSGGTGILKTNKGTEALEKGDMFFLEKGKRHKYNGDENFTTTYLGFDGELCDNIFEYFKVKNGDVFRGKNYEAIEMLICEFFDGFDDISNSARLSAQAYSIVTGFFYEAQKNKITPIEKVKKYLASNFGKQLSLEDIMQIYPYSKSKLCRDFSEKYNMSIFEMLTKIRLNHAKIILKSDPYVSLKEVAASCGFNDVSYFCKMYKKTFGISPKKSMN